MSNSDAPSFGSTLGNPAPLGLAAFGTTTFYLMTIDMGWTEGGFEDLVAANAFYYGGICQLLVGIVELLKGSSFSFLVFCSYGAFWLGFARLYFETRDETSLVGKDEGGFPIGKTFYFVQWTVLSAFFTLVATRKNRALTILLGLLTTTFGLLAITTGLSIDEDLAASSAATKKIAGYFGFATALMAYYMCFAEIINEEWGRHVLPGFQPTVAVPRMPQDPDEFAREHLTYDKGSNTLMCHFRGVQILTGADVALVYAALERKILAVAGDDGAAGEDGVARVHVVVDYRDANIASGAVEEEYVARVAALQDKYYLSVRRFGISSFGTQVSRSAAVAKTTKLG